MCENCGCSEAGSHEHSHNEHTHTHSHDGHTHSHDHSHNGHSHDHDHSHKNLETKTVTVEKAVLARNNEIAEENRRWLKERNIVTVNIISSPGSGKTMLLEKTLEALQGVVSCAVITGDQQTDNDAKRLKGKGANICQVETYTSCHLNAEHIKDVLPDIIDDSTRLLFIENVGNLVCPAAFDLGEDFKIALLSTAEGEDKALKYPVLFSNAQLAVISKTDLLEHLDFDIAECRKSIRQVHPGIYIFELSAKTGSGMDEWLNYLKKLVS